MVVLPPGGAYSPKLQHRDVRLHVLTIMITAKTTITITIIKTIAFLRIIIIIIMKKTITITIMIIAIAIIIIIIVRRGDGEERPVVAAAAELLADGAVLSNLNMT